MSNFQGEVLAELVRNGLVESIHSGHLVMLNSDGSVYKSKGAVDMPIFPRSTVKSFQASAMVRSGLKLEPRLLALVASSHSGAKVHQDGVLEILALHNLAESDLQNMLDKPLGTTERDAWGDKAPTRLAMNCSGKHAGMLATCVINGWDTKTYLEQSHPLQQAVLKEIETCTSETVANKTFDGCGAPLFAISTMGLARAIHKITTSSDPVHQEVLAAHYLFPEMIGGEGRLNTRMMQAIPGLMMKDGMEAVLVSSLRDGRTLVMKIADGSLRAAGLIAQAAFAEWDINTTDESVKILGGSEVVGGIRATL
jgi:L-asparaginase II